MTNQLTRVLSRKETVNPRTILGFFAAVLVILVVGSCAIVAAILGTGRGVSFIPLILGFCALVAIGLLVVVIVLAVRDPSKLLLTHISGTEYVAIQHVLLGDSTSGEHLLATPDELGATSMAVIPDLLVTPQSEIEGPAND